MAIVPGCDQSTIDTTKITGYLLSGKHPIGRGKARFFKRFGFREDLPEELA
jgi:hypothetical protein